MFLIAAALALGARRPGRAFCGFYVAKADAKLFNKASQVVLVRDGDRTVLTMANDYRGDPREFAIVVPVPTVLEREQIHVAEPALVEHLDAYTAPRLVEYFDADPCAADDATRLMESMAAPASAAVGAVRQDTRAKSLGVTIEAQYTVGEYDILILSARESDGLETWLTRQRLSRPGRRHRVLGSYLKQGMRFFVAKVNLDRAGASSASATCGRCRWPTSRRSSCCRSASAWSTPTARRSCSSTPSRARAASRRRTTAPCGCPPTSSSRPT